MVKFCSGSITGNQTICFKRLLPNVVFERDGLGLDVLGSVQANQLGRLHQLLLFLVSHNDRFWIESKLELIEHKHQPAKLSQSKPTSSEEPCKSRLIWLTFR